MATAIAIARWRVAQAPPPAGTVEGVRAALPGLWLTPAILFFSFAFAWRDSPTLGLANLIALGTAAGLAVSPPAWLTGLTRYGLSLLVAGVQVIAGPLGLLLKDITYAEVEDLRPVVPVLTLGRGLMVAVPVALVFGGLLTTADPVFERFVRDLFDWDFEEIAAYATLGCACTWIASGALREVLTRRERDPEPVECPGFLQLGIAEIALALTILDLIFLAFVVIQFRYLFGSAELTVGLSHSAYARRGFFELVWATGLALPLLLLADWTLRAGRPWYRWLFRVLAAALVAMLYVVMASAVYRMSLYVQEFGLTELRLYTTAFMLWLAIVFVWFVATVLTDRRPRFAIGALVSAFLVVLALNAIDPDAQIVRANVARNDLVRGIDVRYLTCLSTDAVPALVEALPAMNETERKTVAMRLLNDSPSETDWRTWNTGRAQTRQLVDRHRQELEAWTSHDQSKPLPRGVWCSSSMIRNERTRETSPSPQNTRPQRPSPFSR